MTKATGYVRVLTVGPWEDVIQVGPVCLPATKGIEWQRFITLPLLYSTAPAGSAARFGHLRAHCDLLPYHSMATFVVGIRRKCWLQVGRCCCRTG